MPQEVTTPDWVKHAVFYQVFPDRFAKSERVAKPNGLEAWDAPPTNHGYKGGDLRGLAERLDHLEGLGITAIYLNPVFQSASNHRYHTHDYFRVDPMLGGDDALRELLDAAHARGMRVILDGVFNHASRGFFQFNDLLENGPASVYRDWWHVKGFPLGAYGEGDGQLRYSAWWGIPALPKFNTELPAVREFLWSVGEHWLRFGIDGWRLDVPNEIDDDAFWREFRRRCLAVNPDAYIVGEIWTDAERWLQGDQFDAVMNYPLGKAIMGLAGRRVNQEEVARCGYHHIPHLGAQAAAAAITRELERHPSAITQAQLNLLGSHDTPRLATILGEDASAIELATLLQFTLPGAPCVYYGDEIGLSGGHDPACRAGMPWDQPERWDGARLEHHRQLIALRRAHEALRTGSVSFLPEQDGVLVMRRRVTGAEAAAEAQQFLVMVNPQEREAVVELPAAQPGQLPRSLFGEGKVAADGERLRYRLPPRSGAVWVEARAG